VFYFVKTPLVIRQLYKHVTWKLPNDRSAIYLTFDDGPIPSITERTLAILKEHDVKATFFCVGENVLRHGAIFDQIINDGHHIGNHSHQHLNGWKTENETYYQNIEKCQSLTKTSLLRPPYGKIKREQIVQLKGYYTIVMWDVLSGDFDPKTSVEKVVSNVVNNTESGSIIVLHDNSKCGEKMLEALPQIIHQLKAKGLVFETIPYVF
jgi:peptidoglycan/xylan/chitin deacetylase (PgdA/CDA1 family)